VTLSTEAARGDYDWRSQYSAEELVPLGWQLKTSRTSGAPYYLEFWSNHVQEEGPRSPICLDMSSSISIVSAGCLPQAVVATAQEVLLGHAVAIVGTASGERSRGHLDDTEGA
jgi:hypothetical protein